MNFEFDAGVRMVSKHWIIDIPKEISSQFATRGMLLARVFFRGNIEICPIEPNGVGGHWFELLKEWGDLVDSRSERIRIELLDVWEPPILPEDFFEALESYHVLDQWAQVTNKAKWEWVRWIRSTGQENTRKKRILAACDKLLKGNRRPCCFDTSRCTVVEVSKSGKLL